MKRSRCCPGLIRAWVFLAGLSFCGWASSAPAAPSAARFGRLPAHVEVYAASGVGDAQTCVVGAATDADGMHERPVAYLFAGRRVAWHRRLAIPADDYQGRATHCTASPATVYVLVQVDTEAAQSISQTLLQVVAIDRRSGVVRTARSAEVPGVAAAYTAWVDEGAGNFRLGPGGLVITGHYDLMSDRADPTGKAPTPFTLTLPIRPCGAGGGR